MAKSSRTKIITLIFSALSSVISLLTTFFIAKPLGAETYGKVQFYIGVIQITSVVCSFGMQYFVTKNMQVQKHKTNFVFSCICFVILWGLTVFPFYYRICNDLLTGFSNVFIIVLVFISSLSMAVMTCVGASYLGQFKSSTAVFVENLFPKSCLFLFSISLIFCLSSTILFPDTYVIFYSLIYGSLSLFFIFKFFRKINFKSLFSDFLQLISFFALTLTFSLNTSLSKVIGSEIYDNFSGVGALSLCFQIISVAKIFSGVIITISKPSFAKLQNDTHGLIKYFQKIIRVNSYIVIPFCFGFIAQAKFILSLFGSDYSIYFYLLIIVCIETLISELTGPNGTMLAMSGHEKLELLNGVINIIVFLVSSILFSKIGIIGLSLASLIAVLVTNIMKFIEVTTVYKINPYNIKLALHIIIMGLISFLIFYLLSFINITIVLLVCDIFVGCALILAFNLFSPFKDDKFFFFRQGE